MYHFVYGDSEFYVFNSWTVFYLVVRRGNHNTFPLHPFSQEIILAGRKLTSN